MASFSSVYGGNCWSDGGMDGCRVLAEQGDAHAQYTLGRHSFIFGPSEELKWLRRAAEQGHTRAQASVGYWYYMGRGLLENIDHKEAVNWFRKAAEKGHAESQYTLGVMYLNGLGVGFNVVMADMYFRISEVNGHVPMGLARWRGYAENKMTSSQIVEAEKLAREWIQTH